MSAGADPRRGVPPLHELLESPAATSWVRLWGRDPVKSALRHASDEVRRGLANTAPGEDGAGGDDIRERVLEVAHGTLRAGGRSSLRRVLNGTGVVLHTNLGRAPLSEAASAAVTEIVRGYSNLEYDLQRGGRGSRHSHCVSLVADLTGSEAALVVNNNAAAVSLAVNELAAGRQVIVSRGELVEIGGSFRLPDVVERSGAVLRAVGTTNRTRFEDYRGAIGSATGLIMKVHPSNYRIEGFTDSVPLEELVGLGREAGIPVVHDQGSGLLHETHARRLGLDEPGLTASVEAGADLVTWSADKLFGGPQAGIIHGRADLVGRLRANPLARAFRVDKMTLAALEATLLDCRDPDRALDRIPVLRMIAESRESVEARATEALAGAPEILREAARVTEMHSVIGGGSLPGTELPSSGLEVTGSGPDAIDAACRAAEPPLVGRIERGAFLVDFRTLLPGEEALATAVLAAALEKGRSAQ